MRTLIAKLIVYGLAAAFVLATFDRLMGAPADSHYVVLYASRIERVNHCLPTWTQAKVYRCDRIFADVED